MNGTSEKSKPHPASSLKSAAHSLLKWAERQASHSHPTTGPITAKRCCIPVVISPHSILPWLRAHPARQKLFFRARHSPFQVAAVSFSHRASGPVFDAQAHAHLLTILDPADPCMRFYGATRFHASAVQPLDEWAPYNGYTFVLPAVELLCDSGSRVYLAVNYYAPAGLDLIRFALANVVAPSSALSNADPTLMIPRALRVDNVTHFPAWNAAMTRILNDITLSEYDKIVLVRQKLFTFHKNAPPCPLHILAALAHQNVLLHPGKSARVNTPMPNSTIQMPHTSSSPPSEAQPHSNAYLFCLQIDHDKAFLGCTPERLFKLDGRTVLTEALAATVRLGPHDDLQEALALLLNEKNLDEHRFVVDYVTEAMSRCQFQPQTIGPHVRRLPRLMHLATHISATLPSNRPMSHQNDVFQLLSELHPTPAVCGVPREITLNRITEIESFDRGLFAGPFGWFSASAADFCVAIRSASVHGLCVTAYAGSGIVQASESKSEWEETELKMAAFTHLFGRNVPSEYPASSKLTCSPLLPTAPLYESTGFQNSHIDIADRDELGEHEGAITQDDDREKEENKIVQAVREEGTCNYFDPSEIDRMPNLNAVWGCSCIEELCRLGVNTFFVSPGSRSAPLAIGVARSRHARKYVAHDERGAAYLAVGYARATGIAAAVVTSSGTAVANLLPGTVEAYLDELPLILLTADRPPELRDTGANQAIHQVGIFGRYVEWSKDVPCPCDKVSLRNLLCDVDYAVHRSGSEGYRRSGVRQHCAPVHLNMMFREKLAPDEEAWDRKCIADVTGRWRSSTLPLTDYSSLHRSGGFVGLSGGHGSEGFSSDLWNILKSKKNGVIFLGGGPGSVRTEDDALSVYELSEILDWPIVSDICGGVRLDSSSRGVIHYADIILSSATARQKFVADAVLQFGERITSKRSKAFIHDSSTRRDDFVHMLISTGCNRNDEHFTLTHRVNGDVGMVRDYVRYACTNLFAEMPISNVVCKTVRKEGNDLSRLLHLSSKVDEAIEEQMLDSMNDEHGLSEPWCARMISKYLSKAGDQKQCLYVGNSMPIRDFDMYGSAQVGGSGLQVVANRGASGIDGVISSGIGYAIGSNRNSTIVLGDMSFIHDINALHLLRGDDKANALPCRVTIVVINNGGGAIFSMLPIAKHDNILTPLFDTPHRVQFEGVCRSFRVKHVMVRTMAQLESALQDDGIEHRVLEIAVSCDHGQNAALHAALTQDIVRLVDSLCCHDDN